MKSFVSVLIICILALAVTTTTVSISAQSTTATPPQRKQPPVMGIFTNDASWCGGNPPSSASNAKHCVEGFYVRWLEMSGIRVVPFPWNASTADQLYLAQRINGILFPGGGLDGTVLDEYVSKASQILSWAIDWNKKGDKFVLWGTCQGFQVLSAAAARNPNIIVGPYQGMYPSMMPLNFTSNAKTSRMFGDSTCPTEIRNWLTTRPTTLNWHHEIIKPETFTKYPTLGQIFVPTATDNVPNTNTEFVAAMEGSNGMNLFATQFHPERPPYEFSNDIISHTYETIAVSQYLSAFVADKLRENDHAFENPDDLESRIIENWAFQYNGWGDSIFWGN